MRGTLLSSLFGMVLIVLTTLGATAQQADIESTITGQFEAFNLKGFTYLLDYQMVETTDGWRIAAVQLLDAPSVSA